MGLRALLYPEGFATALRRCRSGGPKRILMIGIVLLALPVAHGRAEPDAALRFLMQEPISMLDWGFKNIEDHLMRNRDVLTGGEKELFQPEPSISADYDWAGDTIRISIGLRVSEKTQKTPATMSAVQEQVAFVVKYARGLLTLKPYDAYFRHRGFRSRETPDNLERKLTEVTELIVTARDKDANILSMCKATLSGEALEWLKIGEK